ncbi:mast cell carboxypeptidase A-like [Argiope bruennichi]|uniref:mast cell carboxypeptidase A-like n=1 Tax=Argiope bruennichi TaxID=94029 RepID=UPI0024950537|nr:mast cell carboxypeptidase A-like [Argiope bruennichi]
MNYVPLVSDMLKKHSVEFEMHQFDMEHKIREEISSLRDERYEEFGYNYAKHNPFSSMCDLLKGLTDKYRRISKLEIAGCTVERRPVFAVHISKTQSKTKPVILIECGIHAREWSAFEVCFYIISELLKQKTEKVQKLTSMYDFVILPALNPDGYVYSWTKDRMWRKNRSCDLPKEQCENICIGVDINRNFDVNFYADDLLKMPCTEDYRGKSPFSERESQVVKKIIKKLQNRLLAYFCFHSFLSVWTFPWAKTKELPENYEEMERVAKVATDTLQTMSNNTAYKTGSAANMIYVVPGTSADYAYDVGGAKYAFNVELRQGKEEKGGFIMSESEIIPLCEETFAALENCILAMQPNRS